MALLNSWRRTTFKNTTSHPVPNYSVSAGTNRIVVVVLDWEHNQASELTSTVKYGGVTLEKATETTIASSSRSQGSAIHYLLDANIGGSTVTVTFNTAPNDLVVSIACYDSIDQSTPIVDTDSNADLEIKCSCNLTLEKSASNIFIGTANGASSNGTWVWPAGYTDVFGTYNGTLTCDLATRETFGTGTLSVDFNYAQSGYEHTRLVATAVLLGVSDPGESAEDSISGPANASSDFTAFSSQEDESISGSAEASESFVTIQSGDEGQYVNQFFYKGAVLYASDLNRMSDNIHVVRTTEASSAEPINKAEGSFWLDIAETSSYQLKVNAPGDNFIAAYSINPVTHKPDFSVALGGDNFVEGSITTNKFGSGQLTNPDFADAAFTKDKIYHDSQSRFGANAIGSGTLANNSVNRSKISSGSILSNNFDLKTASVSGSSGNVTISLSKHSLMPDFRSSSTNMRIAGHNTTQDRDNPKVRLYGNGSSYSYSVAWYYVDET